MADFAIKTVLKAVDTLTAPFRRAVGGIKAAARGAFGAIGGAARLATGAIKGMLLPLGAVTAGLAGIGLVLNRTAAVGDELAKFSRQVGVGVESLQELEYAFDRSGVAPDQFKKAVEKLNVSLGQLRNGEGALNTLLQKQAPAFRKQLLATQNTEEALDLMIRALRELEDPSTKATLAMAAFGKAGVKMTRIADNTSEQLQSLRDEKRRDGVISTEAANKAEAYIDALTAQKSAMAGLKAEIAAGLLPVVQPLIEQLTAWIRANRELVATRVQAVVKGLADALQRIDFAAIAAGASAFLDKVVGLWDGIGGLNGVVTGLQVLLAGKLVGLIAAVTTGILGLAAAFEITKASAGWITLAVAAVAAIAVLVVRNWEPIKAFFVGLWRDVSAAFQRFGAYLSDTFGPPIAKVVAGLKRLFGPLIEWFRANWENIKAVFSGVLTFLGEVFMAGWRIIARGATAAWDGLSAAFKLIWDGITGAFTWARDLIVGVIDAIVPDALRDEWEGLKETFRLLWDGIVGIFKGAWEVIKGIIGWVVDGVQDIKDAAADLVDFGDQLNGPADKNARRVVSDYFVKMQPTPAVPLPTPATVAAARGGKAEADIRVRFDNAPPGTSLDRPRTSGGGVRVTTDLGTRPPTFGG